MNKEDAIVSIADLLQAELPKALTNALTSLTFGQLLLLKEMVRNRILYTCELGKEKVS